MLYKAIILCSLAQKGTINWVQDSFLKNINQLSKKIIILLEEMAEVYFCQFLSKFNFYFMCMGFFWPQVCLFITWMPGQKRALDSPELELDSCKLPCGYWKLNLDLLWKQQVLPGPISFLNITISAVGKNLMTCDSILKTQVHIKITIIWSSLRLFLENSKISYKNYFYILSKNLF